MQTLSTYISSISLNALRQFNQHRGMQQGASLSFNTLLCFVPLSAVALFLLKTFGIVENEQSSLIAALDNFLPNYGADEIVSGISEFTNRNLTGLGVGGFLLFLVVSLILFMTVEEHFNDIWGSRRRLPLMQAFQKYSIFYALLLIGPAFNLDRFFYCLFLGICLHLSMDFSLLFVFIHVYSVPEYLCEMECGTYWSGRSRNTVSNCPNWV